MRAPPKQLKGFAKIKLEPGEKRPVSLTLDRRAFSIWDTAAGRWVLAPGKYQILVGSSSRDLPLQTTVTIPPGSH